MKRTVVVAILLGLSVLLGGGAVFMTLGPGKAMMTKAKYERQTKQFMTAFFKGDVDVVLANMDRSMLPAGVTDQQLRQGFQQVPAQLRTELGTLKVVKITSVELPKDSKTAGPTVHVTCECSKKPMKFRITYNPQGKVRDIGEEM